MLHFKISNRVANFKVYEKYKQPQTFGELRQNDIK